MGERTEWNERGLTIQINRINGTRLMAFELGNRTLEDYPIHED